MATKQKTTTVKATSAKKAPLKKKSTSKKVSHKKSGMKSFRVSKPDTKFMTFQPTRQSGYWLVLGVIVIIFTIWIMKLQSDISSIYDSIDSNSIDDSVVLQPKTTLKQ